LRERGTIRVPPAIVRLDHDPEGVGLHRLQASILSH
jgi:hypothetical protein